MELEKLINDHSTVLNDNDYHILGFISQHMDFAQQNPVAKIARQANASASGIVRLTQKLGFNGYSEFRYFLRQEVQLKKAASMNQNTYFQTSDLVNDVNQTIRLYEKDGNLKSLYTRLSQANRVFGYATGYGQSLMLKEFSRCLMGSNVFLNEVPGKSELRMLSHEMHEQDLLFVVGLSGNIQNIQESLATIQLNGTTIVSVTSFSQNMLASMADFNIYYQISKLNKQTKMNETSFSTLNLVLGLVYEGFVNFSNNTMAPMS